MFLLTKKFNVYPIKKYPGIRRSYVVIKRHNRENKFHEKRLELHETLNERKHIIGGIFMYFVLVNNVQNRSNSNSNFYNKTIHKKNMKAINLPYINNANLLFIHDKSIKRFVFYDYFKREKARYIIAFKYRYNTFRVYEFFMNTYAKGSYRYFFEFIEGLEGRVIVDRLCSYTQGFVLTHLYGEFHGYTYGREYCIYPSMIRRVLFVIILSLRSIKTRFVLFYSYFVCSLIGKCSSYMFEVIFINRLFFMRMFKLKYLFKIVLVFTYFSLLFIKTFILLFVFGFFFYHQYIFSFLGRTIYINYFHLFERSTRGGRLASRMCTLINKEGKISDYHYY